MWLGPFSTIYQRTLATFILNSQCSTLYDWLSHIAQQNINCVSMTYSIFYKLRMRIHFDWIWNTDLDTNSVDSQYNQLMILWWTTVQGIPTIGRLWHNQQFYPPVWSLNALLTKFRMNGIFWDSWMHKPICIYICHVYPTIDIRQQNLRCWMCVLCILNPSHAYIRVNIYIYTELQTHFDAFADEPVNVYESNFVLVYLYCFQTSSCT